MMRFTATAALLATAVFLGGCSDSNGSVTDTNPAYSTLAVDASTATAYVALGTPAALANVNDPATSTAWDLAFTSTPTVAVNGGASGPGGDKAYCLCSNQALSLTQIEALSAQSAADAFGAVTAANIPSDAAFEADAASQAISDWYDYDAATHAVTPSEKTWGIRLATASGAYAKFHVVAIPAPGQSSAGPVTIEWATQPTATGTLGADHQLVVDPSSGAKEYVNLTTGTTSAAPTSPWDIALQGYTISVNGGASGTANVAAVALVPSSFYSSYGAITSIPVGTAGIPTSAFTTDGTGGAFLTAPPYRYDPASHQVYPTYDVYLLKHGTAVYKVQVASYYSTGGVFGHLTLRYAKLAD